MHGYTKKGWISFSLGIIYILYFGFGYMSIYIHILEYLDIVYIYKINI